jgi:hypothetical protein
MPSPCCAPPAQVASQSSRRNDALVTLPPAGSHGRRIAPFLPSPFLLFPGLAQSNEVATRYSRTPGSMASGIHSPHIMPPSQHAVFAILGTVFFSVTWEQSCSPWGHPLWVAADKVAREALDKADRENGFIYFHPVPAALPELPEAKSLTVVRRMRGARGLPASSANSCTPAQATPFESPEGTPGWEAATWDASKVPVKTIKAGACTRPCLGRLCAVVAHCSRAPHAADGQGWPSRGGERGPF